MNRDSIAKIHGFLLSKNLTVAVAESCTGGLVSKILTDLPDSSKYFLLGIVSYSNASKTKVLNIPASILARSGAVSATTARLMAQSARRISGADIGIGITGIAGPGGGTKAKPVGTVFIAISTKKKDECRKYHFTGSRAAIREKATVDALRNIMQSIDLQKKSDPLR